jgi:hypothetical protein
LHYDVAQRLALERLDEAAMERAASELSQAA